MAETIDIPAFDYSAFYYPQILEALMEFKRLHVPELTDESPQEPLIQLLRAFACVGHLNNSDLDLVANECTLPTSRLVETVRNMLRLINYEMPSAVPSSADEVYSLSQVVSVQTEIVPQYAQAATRAGPNTAQTFFEALEGITVDPTDELSACFGVDSGSYVDHTTEANTAEGVSTFVVWSTPVGGSSSAEGDSLVVGHTTVMFDRLDFDFSVGGSGLVGVWEFLDGDWEKDTPADVADQGSYLEVRLPPVYNAAGDVINLSGLIVRVMLNSTGAYEDGFVYYSGGQNRVDTAGLLGQAVPSTEEVDYTVGSEWTLLNNVDDETSGLNQDGEVTFDLPQTLIQDWQKQTLEGIEGYYVRFRLTNAPTPVSPTIGQIRIHEGTQYVKALVTQGRRVVSTRLGSSDGTANQRFTGALDYFIDGTAELTVDGVTWTQVDNFLTSLPTDRHYVVELADNDAPVFVFGDGVTGAIPAAGVYNIVGTYRYGANEDGNVGATTITSDKEGLTYVESVQNPRPATGWAEAAGASAASLEAVKITGPAALRTGEVALGPDDIQTLAQRANSIDPAQMKVSRSIAIEEYYGPKTIGLVVVPSGGEYASAAALALMSEFFNGDQFSTPVKPKRCVANQEVTARNYTKRVVDVTVEVETTGNLTIAQVENQLIRILQPEALQDDGVTYVWNFGGRVPVSKLEHEIFGIDSNTTDVDMTVPSADIVLANHELPYVGSLSVVINKI